MFEIPDLIHRFSQAAVASGYMVALTLICVIQYLMHADRIEKLRRKMEYDTRELLRLQREVNVLQKDHSQVRFENQIFEEFLSQPDYDTAMRHLLKRFVPRPEHGFGACLEKRGNAFVWTQARGLSTTELTSISDQGDWLAEFEHRDFQIFDVQSLRHSFLYNYLPAADRRGVQQLFVFAIRHNKEVTGLLVTTALYPAGMALERRISLALRLLNGLEAHFHHSEVIRTQRSQLKTTREMLELRDVTDHYRSAVKLLVQEFMKCLCRQVDGHRMLVAFARQNRPSEIRSLQRVGLRPTPEERVDWETEERHLIKIGQHRNSCVVLDPQELDLHGFNGPIRHAVILPVTPKDQTVGVLCVLRHAGQPEFSESEIRHLQWAAEFLGESLRHSIDLATIEMQAHSDALTSLLNRGTFDRRLDKEIRRARQREWDCSLLLIDLDHFKSINDTFGHTAGDVVLRRVADSIKQVLRRHRVNRSYAARYGGEEFAVVLPGAGQGIAMLIAESIRAAIQEIRLEFKGLECPLTTSAGVAVFPRHADAPRSLIDAADHALYQAKNSGRNRVVCLNISRDSDALIG